MRVLCKFFIAFVVLIVASICGVEMDIPSYITGLVLVYSLSIVDLFFDIKDEKM